MEYFLDTKGFECPIPVLKAKKFIKKLKKKDTILIESDDPLSKFDFKNFCEENNYQLLSIIHSKKVIKIKFRIYLGYIGYRCKVFKESCKTRYY